MSSERRLDFTVVTASDYYTQLLQLIPLALKRITLAAMIVRTGPRTNQLLQSIAAAAQRGVSVTIVADNYARHMVSRPDYLTRKGFKAACDSTQQLLDHIIAHGGTATWIGPIGLNPYAGRYHAKMTIIDDHVFSFGGINMSDDAFQNIDYMFHTKNATLANWLDQLVTQNVHSLPDDDIETAFDSTHTLLFDAGKKGQSIIYSRACQLATNARNITYISQMCPSGKLGQLIKRTSNACYYNQPWQTGWRPASLAQLWDGWRTGLINHYNGRQYIHAKCILFEQQDGRKVVLSGSHNFSWRGVAFGSKEIALQSTDPVLYQRLQEVVHAVADVPRTE